jgi:hypothetical protein
MGDIIIYCHDGNCVKVSGFYSKSRKSPPRAILTPARVGRYYQLYTIYIPPYAIPPTTLTPGSKVRGHRVTGLGSHKVTRSTLSPGLPESPGFVYLTHLSHLWSRVTRPPRHQGHRVTLTRVTRHLYHHLWIRDLELTRYPFSKW